ncbi:creatininase family protein [Paenibacillus silvisoli]|uniref:creatininase family protein n=1 Tax=Paenibacillus silvisoli TaxID=3110539 RepID=UPI0028047203|nr:creatininase family protein [Paenibacillus silvisoli]
MDKVLWSELLPYEFKSRQTDTPIVYLPLGLCEPHGQIAAFGLDTIKAEWLCEQAAKTVGGIVAPSLGYHIHEAGFHARWLEESVGQHNAHMTGMPPHVMLYFFLYQLRAFANSGFKCVIVISGHSGGNQIDYRRAASYFQEHTGVRVWIVSDPELVEGQFQGDHAGRYEISQLMYVRPELVDYTKLSLSTVPGAGGALAIGEDVMEASIELGERIMHACLDQVVTEVRAMKIAAELNSEIDSNAITYEAVEKMWQRIWSERLDWVTSKPWPEQQRVSPNSQWKPYEHAMLEIEQEGE